jgi:hypothetical protein
MFSKILTILLTSSCSSSSSSLSPSERDQSFHAWCDRVGIQTPGARLETTPKSVAGRGVFATEDIPKGTATIQIPEHVVFHSLNARMFFPDVTRDLDRSKKLFFKPNHGGWKQLFRKKIDIDYNFLNADDLWQAELTAYALASMEEGHPWALWIDQWQREDPFQELLESGGSFQDEELILKYVNKMHRASPDVPRNKIFAAVDLRLRRIQEMKKLYDLDDIESIAMLGVLTSRAMALGDGITGVLPMFDMINHSTDPNLGLSFQDGNFELIALRDLKEDEELFVNYMHRDGESNAEWNEDRAVWNLVQWGIPQSKQTKATSKKLNEADSRVVELQR